MPLKRHAVKKYKPHQSPLPDLPEWGMDSLASLSTGLPLFQQRENPLLDEQGSWIQAEGEEEQYNKILMECLFLWGIYPSKLSTHSRNCTRSFRSPSRMFQTSCQSILSYEWSDEFLNLTSFQFSLWYANCGKCHSCDPVLLQRLALSYLEYHKLLDNYPLLIGRVFPL